MYRSIQQNSTLYTTFKKSQFADTLHSQQAQDYLQSHQLKRRGIRNEMTAQNWKIKAPTIPWQLPPLFSPSSPINKIIEQLYKH